MCLSCFVRIIERFPDCPMSIETRICLFGMLILTFGLVHGILNVQKNGNFERYKTNKNDDFVKGKPGEILGRKATGSKVYETMIARPPDFQSISIFLCELGCQVRIFICDDPGAINKEDFLNMWK